MCTHIHDNIYDKTCKVKRSTFKPTQLIPGYSVLFVHWRLVYVKQRFTETNLHTTHNTRCLYGALWELLIKSQICVNKGTHSPLLAGEYNKSPNTPTRTSDIHRYVTKLMPEQDTSTGSFDSNRYVSKGFLQAYNYDVTVLSNVRMKEICVILDLEMVFLVSWNRIANNFFIISLATKTARK